MININKCNMCNKKTGFLGFVCLCGLNHCSSHRYCDVHNCTYDKKKRDIDKLKNDNPIVVSDKIKDRI